MVNEVRLDLKDKKLLYEIDMNARIPYAQLGKKIGLSKQGTEYKMNSLIKKGVIEGFYPVINVSKRGYIYGRLCFTLQNVTEAKEKEIINYLKANPKFFWIFRVQGIYDVFAAMWVKSISDFKNEVDKFMVKYGKYVFEKSTSFSTDVIHYQHRYLLGKKETEEIHVGGSEDVVSLDEKEMKLLEVLCADARISIVRLAEKINVSPKVAAYSLRKLEKQGIICGYRPLINHDKLGYSYYKLWINLCYGGGEKLDKLYDYVRKNVNVIYVVKGVGFPGDLDIEMMIKNSQELFNFIRDLKRKFPDLIGRHQTLMFSNTEKVRYLPF